MKVPQLFLGLAVLISLPLLNWTAGSLVAQEGTAATKPYDIKPGNEKPLTAAQLKAEQERIRVAKADVELRARLDNTVWNDLDLRAGQPGQVWMFRPGVQRGKRVVREWLLNDDVKLPLVGSWKIDKEELLLYALDGTLIGRGKYADDEINGRFIDPDRQQEFGKFRLQEESKRTYRVLPLRVNTRTLGK